MPVVTLHFSIEHSEHYGSPTLWVKELDTSFCPQKGNRIMLIDYDGEVNDGPLMVPVKETYWNTDGTVGIDMEDYVVDPSESMAKHVQWPGAHQLWAWYTEQSGDLESALRAGGWKRRFGGR